MMVTPVAKWPMTRRSSLASNMVPTSAAGGRLSTRNAPPSRPPWRRTEEPALGFGIVIPPAGGVRAAVDREVDPGHVGREVGGEEHRRARDVLGDGWAPEGDEMPIAVLLRRDEHLLEALGEADVGRDRVHPDGVGRQLEGHRTREIDHRGFA